MERMFSRDRTVAWLLVALLWLCLAFVYFAVARYVDDGGIRLALAVSALVLLAFNTASIAAMVRHYRADRDHIYGLDLRHLDEARRARGQ
jgi:uncharacterized membrane protein YccF (DUF307 family)